MPKVIKAFALVTNGKLWRNECILNKGQYFIFKKKAQYKWFMGSEDEVKRVTITIEEREK